MTNADYFLNKEMTELTENSKLDTCVTASSTLENDCTVYANTAQTFVVPQFGLL